MKKNLTIYIAIAVITLGFATSSYAQLGDLTKKPKQKANNDGFTKVTLHNDVNFLGEFLEVDATETGFRNLNDFNDIASSITVPKGFVAIIFEHADNGGGYGRSVDLLEDCADLSIYGFNNIVSSIIVYKTNRAGFFWARGSMRNGEFMPGHWERTPVSGIPVNKVAVVSPPIPRHTASLSTGIQQNDSLFTITSLGTQSSQDVSYSNLAETLMGVIGSDFHGVEEIGSAAFERASNNLLIPDSINFWYPQKSPRDHRNTYFKRTLSGTIAGGESEPQIAEIEGTYEDHDLNLDIIPSQNYMYLISEGHKPELSLQQSVKLTKENIRFHNPTGEFENPCTKPFDLVEAEIDTRLNAKSAINFLTRQRVGKQIAVYGPWIYDKGHCFQPEIHPAEQIWWSENEGTNKKYNLNVFCDSSKRFWWRSQMDDGTKLKPWGAPPIKGTFAIAFEVEIGKGGKKFEVTNIEDYNVAVIPNTDKIYNLTYQNNVLVSFVPHNDAFKVSFENVGLKPGTTNIVRGFLVLETTVGTVTQITKKVTVTFPNNTGGTPQFLQIDVPAGTTADKIDEKYEQQVFKKVDGHYMFSILRTTINQPLNKSVTNKNVLKINK